MAKVVFGDFIPENDPVRVLDAIVEHLDISAIEATYKGGGASSFAPRMLLKVILVNFNTINLFRRNQTKPNQTKLTLPPLSSYPYKYERRRLNHLLVALITVCLGRIISSLRISDRTCQRDLQCQRASSYQCRMGEMC